MGRHGAPAARRQVPWELLGWGAFACLLAAVAVRWFDDSWTAALLVLGAGAVVLLVLTAVVMSASPRRGGRPAP